MQEDDLIEEGDHEAARHIKRTPCGRYRVVVAPVLRREVATWAEALDAAHRYLPLRSIRNRGRTGRKIIFVEGKRVLIANKNASRFIAPFVTLR